MPTVFRSFLMVSCMVQVIVHSQTTTTPTSTQKNNDTNIDWAQDVIVFYEEETVTMKMEETRTLPLIMAVSCPNSDLHYHVTVKTYSDEVAYFPGDQKTSFHLSCNVSTLYHTLAITSLPNAFSYESGNVSTELEKSLANDEDYDQNNPDAQLLLKTDSSTQDSPIIFWSKKSTTNLVEIEKDGATAKEQHSLKILLSKGMAQSLHSRLVFRINLSVTADLIGRSWLIFATDDSSRSHGNVPYSSGVSEAFYKDNANSEIRNNHSDMEGDRNVVYEIPVVVLRNMRPIDFMFRIVLYILLGLSSVGMGCKTDLQVVKEVLKKPIAPVMGFIAQYICMPLIAFLISQVVKFDNPAVRLGIFACGVCPGGGASNIFSYLLHGDISLSVTMTCISSLSALAMIPLWMLTLGQRFNDDKISITVPFMKILETLVIVIAPLVVGFIINIKFPKIAAKFKKIIKFVAVITIIFILTVGVYSNLYMFRLFKGGTVAAACLLPYAGYLCGVFLAFVACQKWARIKTVAIETGIQNTTVAYLMLTFSLPAPDSDLAAVGSASSALMTPIPLLILSIFYAVYYKCKKRKDSKENADKANSSTNEEAIPMTKKDGEIDDNLKKTEKENSELDP